MQPSLFRRLSDALLAAVALVAIGASVWNLRAATADLAIERVTVGEIPATVFRPAAGPPGPAVVIAHGFAGSQQLMQSFAITLARNGYVAVTFDLAGHGRNPEPLTGSVTDTSGATRKLVDETAEVAGFARRLGDGRLAVLGHSMASDVVVRFAEATPDVAATVAVSMFSPAVTAHAPRNLLVIVGGWEGMLKREALRVVGLSVAPAPAAPSVTYGTPADGSARRIAFSPHVEHVGVLFSRASMQEAVGWFDAAFGIERAEAPILEPRGLWILLLFAGVVALARPLSRLLPTVAAPPIGASLRWSRLWPTLFVPMFAAPLLLRFLPTHFLPVLVGDYLAAHFALYGALTALCLLLARRPVRERLPARRARAALAVATAAVISYGFVGLVWPIDTFVTSFVPGRERLFLVLAMLAGTLPYFLADEWATRAPGAGRLAYPASKLAFLVSLAIAVALDFRRLFFLVIIVPVIMLFFVVYGLISRWSYARTGDPAVAATASALAFAWAIGVTFPLVAG
ncbi:MAG: alpha/beta fold hydrolase [Amaricoccus sp.]